MTDYLSQYKIWNTPIKNRTQTMFTRFVQMPHGETRTFFSDSQEDWKRRQDLFKNYKLKTKYDQYFENAGGESW